MLRCPLSSTDPLHWKRHPRSCWRAGHAEISAGSHTRAVMTARAMAAMAEKGYSPPCNLR